MHASSVLYRGKPFGHDIDLLLSHSEREVTDSLLDTLVDHLKRQVIDCTHSECQRPIVLVLPLLCSNHSLDHIAAHTTSHHYLHVYMYITLLL